MDSFRCAEKEALRGERWRNLNIIYRSFIHWDNLRWDGDIGKFKRKWNCIFLIKCGKNIGGMFNYTFNMFEIKIFLFQLFGKKISGTKNNQISWTSYKLGLIIGFEYFLAYPIFGWNSLSIGINTFFHPINQFSKRVFINLYRRNV